MMRSGEATKGQMHARKHKSKQRSGYSAKCKQIGDVSEVGNHSVQAQGLACLSEGRKSHIYQNK